VVVVVGVMMMAEEAEVVAAPLVDDRDEGEGEGDV